MCHLGGATPTCCTEGRKKCRLALNGRDAAPDVVERRRALTAATDQRLTAACAAANPADCCAQIGLCEKRERRHPWRDNEG